MYQISFKIWLVPLLKLLNVLQLGDVNTVVSQRCEENVAKAWLRHKLDLEHSMCIKLRKSSKSDSGTYLVISHVFYSKLLPSVWHCDYQDIWTVTGVNINIPLCQSDIRLTVLWTQVKLDILASTYYTHCTGCKSDRVSNMQVWI